MPIFLNTFCATTTTNNDRKWMRRRRRRKKRAKDTTTAVPTTTSSCNSTFFSLLHLLFIIIIIYFSIFALRRHLSFIHFYVVVRFFFFRVKHHDAFFVFLGISVDGNDRMPRWLRLQRKLVGRRSFFHSSRCSSKRRERRMRKFKNVKKSFFVCSRIFLAVAVWSLLKPISASNSTDR